MAGDLEASRLEMFTIGWFELELLHGPAFMGGWE